MLNIFLKNLLTRSLFLENNVAEIDRNVFTEVNVIKEISLS